MTDATQADDAAEPVGADLVLAGPSVERRKMQRRRAPADMHVDTRWGEADRRLGLGRRWQDWRRR